MGGYSHSSSGTVSFKTVLTDAGEEQCQTAVQNSLRSCTEFAVRAGTPRREPVPCEELDRRPSLDRVSGQRDFQVTRRRSCACGSGSKPPSCRQRSNKRLRCPLRSSHRSQISRLYRGGAASNLLVPFWTTHIGRIGPRLGNDPGGCQAMMEPPGANTTNVG